VNERIPVNLLQNGIQVFVQPEKMDHEVLFHSFVEENVPFLPEREQMIGGLDKVGPHGLGISEKLAAFQRILERESGDPEASCHSFFSAGGRIIAMA
jgi:hypothetical protein